MRIDAKKFREVMERDGRTVEQLAEASGVSTFTINRMRGGHEVMPRCLGYVSAALNIDPTEIAPNSGYNKGYKTKNAPDEYAMQICMARAMMGITDLAYELGVTYRVASAAAKGQSCKPQNLKRIADLLGVDVEDLRYKDWKKCKAVG